MNETWFNTLQSVVFTKAKKLIQAELGTYYPEMNYTTNGQSNTNAIFPTWYLHELAGLEQGQDLTNVTVNAMMAYFRIEVFVNTAERDCREIMATSITAMKSMGFNVAAMPIYQVNKNVIQGVADFRRMIGAGDNDLAL